MESLTVVPLRLDDALTLCGPIARIPPQSSIDIVGQSSLNAMLDIEWHGHRYAAFAVDIRQRCKADGDESAPVFLCDQG